MSYAVVLAFGAKEIDPSSGGPFHSQLLEWPAATFARGKTRRMTMKNPLDSLWGTIISGLILTAILYFAVRNFLM